MTYILDRFEDDIAVLVSADGGTVSVMRAELKAEDPREGDAFVLTDGQFVRDAVLTGSRRKAIGSKFSRLVKNKRKKDSSGNPGDNKR